MLRHEPDILHLGVLCVFCVCVFGVFLYFLITDTSTEVLAPLAPVSVAV